MNALPIKLAFQYVGRWVAIIFFVVLLTVIFSFLGTIICAVLAGMMMGATRHSRWQAVAIAIVFPTVIFTLLRGSRAQLLEKQVIILALLCFAAFWVLYFVTSLVIRFERGQYSTSSATVQNPSAPTTQELEPINSPVPVDPIVCMSLEAIQGEWVCNGSAGHREERKHLTIRENKITLSVIKPDGTLRPLAHGEVSVGPSQRPQSSEGPPP